MYLLRDTKIREAKMGRIEEIENPIIVDFNIALSIIEQLGGISQGRRELEQN